VTALPTSSPVVCGELSALVCYISGVEIKTDVKNRRIDLRVKSLAAWSHSKDTILPIGV